MRKKNLLPALFTICFSFFIKITSAMEIEESAGPSLQVYSPSSPISIGSVLIPLSPEQLHDMFPKRFSQRPAPAEIQAFHTTYALAFKKITILFETKEILEIMKSKVISDQKFLPIIDDLTRAYKNIQKHESLTKQSLGKIRTKLVEILEQSVPYLNLRIPQMTFCFPDNQTYLPFLWKSYALQYTQHLLQSHHKYHPASKASIELMKLWLPVAMLYAYSSVFEGTKPDREKIAFNWTCAFIYKIQANYKFPPSFTLFIPDVILKSALTGAHHPKNVSSYTQELLRRNISNIVELKADLQDYLEKILSNTLPEKDYERVALCFDALLGPGSRYLEEKTPDIPICTGALLLHCQLGHHESALYYAQKILEQNLQDPPPLLLAGLACAFIMNHQPEHARPFIETILKIPSEKFSWGTIPVVIKRTISEYIEVEVQAANHQNGHSTKNKKSKGLFRKRKSEAFKEDENQHQNLKKLKPSQLSLALPEIPDEIIDLILTNLSWTDWENIRLTSGRFKSIAEDPQTTSFKGLASFFRIFQDFKKKHREVDQVNLELFEDYLYNASEAVKKLKSDIKDFTNQKAFVKQILQKTISTPVFVFCILRLNLVSEWPETMIHAVSKMVEDKHPEIHKLWLPFASIIALEDFFFSCSSTEDPAIHTKVLWWQNHIAFYIHEISKKIFSLYPQHQEFELLTIEDETSRPLSVLMKEEDLARVDLLLRKYLTRNESQYFRLLIHLAQQIHQLTQKDITSDSLDLYQNELGKLQIWISALSDQSMTPKRYNDAAHHYLRAAIGTVLHFLSADFGKARVWLNQAFLYSQQFNHNDFEFLKLPYNQPYHLGSLHQYAGNIFLIRKDWEQMLDHYDTAKSLGSNLSPQTLCQLIKGALALNDEKRAFTYLNQLHQHQNALATFESYLSLTKLNQLYSLLGRQGAPETYLQFIQRWKLRRIQQLLN